MAATRTGVRSAMLTGLGMAALALTGEPLSRVPAGAAGQAPQTAREAGRPPEAAMDEDADRGRDPFVRPTAPGPRRPVGVRPSGLSGLAVDEAVLRGVVSSREGRLALLEGPDARAYVVKPGDRLHDATMREITRDGVLLVRDATDSVPLAERMVRKRLRGEEVPR